MSVNDPYVFPPKTKIFGREPAVILSLVAAVINMGSAWLFHLSEDQTTALNVVVALVLGFAIAVFTKDSLLAVGLGLFQALVALGTAFGFQIAPDKQGAIMAFLNVVLAMWHRDRTEPTPNLSLHDEPHQASRVVV